MTQTMTKAASWRYLLLAVGLAAFLLAGCGPTPKAATATATAVTSAGTVTVPAGYHRKCALGQALDQCPAVKDSPPPTTSVPKPAAAAVKPPTVAQQQALKAAQDYIDEGPFSRAGLLKQLASEYGEGFTKSDAAWAVAHVNADWNAEAVEAARSYLEMGGFSRSGLIKQLSSKYGDQFTKAEATQAAKKVGL